MGFKDAVKKWARPVGAEQRDAAEEEARASGASEQEAQDAGEDALKQERKKKLPGMVSGGLG